MNMISNDKLSLKTNHIDKAINLYNIFYGNTFYKITLFIKQVIENHSQMDSLDVFQYKIPVPSNIFDNAENTFVNNIKLKKSPLGHYLVFYLNRNNTIDSEIYYDIYNLPLDTLIDLYENIKSDIK